MNKPKLGSGARFSALKEKLSHEKGIKDPGAVAASIGAKKFGQTKMTKMAQAGKNRRK